MERKEPVRYRAKDMVMRLRPPYGDMVLRVQGLSSELLEQGRRGNEFATLDAARRLMARTSALVELLEMALKGSTKQDLRITNYYEDD